MIRIYASELLDKRTCGPCRRIDGRRFTDWADAKAAYPWGTYRACEGGPRCRGMLVVLHDDTQPDEADLPAPVPVQKVSKSFRQKMTEKLRSLISSIVTRRGQTVTPARAGVRYRRGFSLAQPPGDDMWEPQGDWSRLRGQPFRVQRVSEKDWTLQELRGGQWKHVSTTYWAETTRQHRVLANLKPPGYAWKV